MTGKNTNPEDKIEDKHQVFNAAKAPLRRRHPAKNQRKFLFKEFFTALCPFQDPF